MRLRLDQIDKVISGWEGEVSLTNKQVDREYGEDTWNIEDVKQPVDAEYKDYSGMGLG